MVRSPLLATAGRVPPRRRRRRGRRCGPWPTGGPRPGGSEMDPTGLTLWEASPVIETMPASRFGAVSRCSLAQAMATVPRTIRTQVTTIPATRSTSKEQLQQQRRQQDSRCQHTWMARSRARGCHHRQGSHMLTATSRPGLSSTRPVHVIEAPHTAPRIAPDNAVPPPRRLRPVRDASQLRPTPVRVGGESLQARSMGLSEAPS